MKAGALTQRVTLQRYTEAQTDSGEPTQTYADIGTYWAEIVALAGRELEIARQAWAEARYRVTVRYQSGVTFGRKDRLSWGSPAVYLDILDAVDPTQSRERIVMICKEWES